MEIREFERRSFAVNAVEVDLNNVEEVAAWCKGEVTTEKVKMIGTETVLPCIKLKGQGDKKDQTFTASLGHWVVELKGSFRVYKPQQFKQAFVEKRKPVTRGIVGVPQSDGSVEFSGPEVDLPSAEQLESHI